VPAHTVPRRRPSGPLALSDPAAPTVHAGPARPEPRLLVRIVAVAAITLLAMRIHLPQGLEVGHLLAVALSPLWIPQLARHRGAVPVALLVLASVGGGIWLTVANEGDHLVSTTAMVSSSVQLIGVLLGIGVVLWSRGFLRSSTIAVWYGVGMVAGIDTGGEQFATNPWKFGFAIPVAVLLLALAWRQGSRNATPIALVVLVVLAGINDSRSELAILFLVLLAVVWQMIPTRAGRRARVSTTLLGLGALAALVYNAGQAFILEGYLGEATRQRTETQLDEAGSVIVGGRPELGATQALFEHRPWGFGSGTLANSLDVGVAKTGMAALNYDPDNGYVERYMFGQGYEVHSILGDLWARFGVMGILLSLALVVVVLLGVSRDVSHRAAAGLVVYLAAKTLWNMPFSPLYSSVPLIVITVGLLLVPRSPAWPPVSARLSPLPARAERAKRLP
jgi:hypothetical protein